MTATVTVIFLSLVIVILLFFDSAASFSHQCQAVPFSLPRIHRLRVPGFRLGHSATIRLEVESDYNVDISFMKTIRTEPRYPGKGHEVYKVPVRTSSTHRIDKSVHRKIYSGSLTVHHVTQEDTIPGRYEAELMMHHPCNKLHMFLDFKRTDIDIHDDQSPVKVEAVPKISVQAVFAQNLHMKLDVGYIVNVNDRVRSNPLSISKWKRYISRTGVRRSIFVLDDWDNPKMNDSGNFFTTRMYRDINEGKYKAESSMALKPFVQRDQGLFRTHFSYDVQRNTVFINVFVTTEVRYSDNIQAALKVQTCSSLADNTVSDEIMVIPIEAGYENCIKCIANGAPMPNVYLASINSDISTGVNFKPTIRSRIYGYMTRKTTYALPQMRAGRSQYYVCSGGRKSYVSSEVVKVVAYEKVKIVRSTPHQVNLQILQGSPVNFTCGATGVPTPKISFYKSPKNSYLSSATTPAKLGWDKLNTKFSYTDRVEITNKYDSAKKQITAKLVLHNASSNSDYHCVAENKYSYKAATLLVDDFLLRSANEVLMQE